jgi:hypothetical protein
MDITYRRSSFLVFFAGVANLYLLAFAADGLVSVGDELWAMVAGSSPLAGLRNQLAMFVVLSSLIMAFVVAFVPHLPKAIFLPLIGAAIWLALGGPPFGSLTSSGDKAGLFLSLCQAALGFAAFLIVHLRTGSPFLSANALPHLSHVFLRIAFASVVTLLVSFAGLVALGIWTAVSYAEQETKGYIQFTWNDIRARTTILRKDNKVVHLVATAHIAERQFYERAYQAIPPNAVVLAEGITDRNGTLAREAARPEEAAKSMGLTSQTVFEEMLAAGETVTADAKPRKPAPTGVRAKPDVVRADVDVSELSPPTLRCLRADLATAAQAETGEVLAKDGGAPACSPDDLKVFWEEILTKRNAVLMAAFDKLQDKYDVFVVPWGAMHMPELEQAFLTRGYRIERAHMLTLARYETVAGHVFGGLAAFRLLGPGTRPYQMRTYPYQSGFGQMPDQFR